MTANLACTILVLARATGALALSPLLGLSQVPALPRFLAAAGLGLAMVPMVEPPVLPEQVPAVALGFAALMELGLGALIGWAASLLIEAVRMAGSLADQEFNLAEGPISDFKGVLAIVILFLVNGHHWFVSGLLKSFTVLQAGSWDLPAASIAGLLAVTFEIMIKLAAPVLIASLLVTLTILLAGRMSPNATPGQGVRPIAITSVLLLSIGITMGILSWQVPEFGTVWSNSMGLN